MSKLREYSLLHEKWREYRFNGNRIMINNPVKLYIGFGGSTHRILTEDGVVYCVPAPGYHGCILSWLPKDPTNPVQF